MVISELPVVGKAGGQFLENLVRLRSKVVIGGAALPRESHDQELCPAHDDRSSKPEMISLVRLLRWSNGCSLVGQDPPEWRRCAQR